MPHFAAMFMLVAVLATNPVAYTPQVQDVTKATQLLKHLRHREMKTDAQGHVWYLDISEQDAVSDKSLVALRHLPHLREVYMIFCPIRGDGLAHLGGLKQIEKLDLCATQIDDNALKHIAKLTTLRYLDIRSVGVTDEGIVKDNHGPVSDDGIEMIVRNLPNLESLLCCGTMTDKGLRQLAKLPKLRYLEIRSPNLSADGIQNLQSAMPDLEIDWSSREITSR